MSSNGRRSRALIVDELRAHRWGTLAWSVGGAAAMLAIGAGFASEVSRSPGGARSMAASLQAGVQAMRLLRWPAERLDTLGGYLTYHNVTLFVLAITLYAAVQGSHAVRGAETTGVLEEILATGRSRVAVLRDRAVGFAVTLALICLGLGLGLAGAMAAGGEPDLGGSFITVLACGLCAYAGYAFGVLVSQLTPTPRAGTAVAALVPAGLYLLTNEWDEIGAFGVVRFGSPFHYFNSSRALVPGHGFDPGSSAILAAMAVVMLVAAGWVFTRRDYAAGLWRRIPAADKPARRARRRVQRRALRTVCGASLLRQRLGLLAWCGAAAGTLALMGRMEPAVVDMWDKVEYIRIMIASEPGRSAADQYLSFAAQLLVPIIVGYVITQAAGWISDLKQGRVELILAAPVSWPGLVRQRLLAVLLGAAVITVAAMCGLAGATTAVGADLDPMGTLRLVADTLLFTAALAAVAAVVVAWIRSAAAVTVLAVIVAGWYLVGYLAPLFDWPEWVTRLSILGAYGNPYLEVPALGGLAVLATLAVPGSLLAAAIAQRSPKTA